jgi:hypothetical protein
VPDIDVVMPEMQDGYIGVEVNLPHRGLNRSGTVQRRARNVEGTLEGTANPNPILDTIKLSSMMESWHRFLLI